MIPIILWSSNPVVTRFLITRGSGVFELITYRSIGALFLSLFLFHRKDKSNSKLFSSFSELLPGIFLFLNFVAFNIALKYLSSYLVMIIEASSFVFSFLFARLTKEKIKFFKPSFLLYFLGIFLLLFDAKNKGSNTLVSGLIFAILASLTFGLYNSTLKYIRKNENKLFATVLPVFLLSLPFTILEFEEKMFLPLRVFNLIIILGFILTAVPYSLWAEAGKRFSGFRLSEFFLITLPGTFIIEYLWLGVSVSLFQIIASIILISALILETLLSISFSTSESSS